MVKIEEEFGSSPMHFLALSLEGFTPMKKKKNSYKVEKLFTIPLLFTLNCN
jgi:hypothetical protein